MIRIAAAALALTLLAAFAAVAGRAQAPSGPIPPKPGVEVQLPPKDTQAKVKVQVALVNTPVTVRDGRGEMVHNLEARDFQITDNGVAQRISHFDLGGDPPRSEEHTSELQSQSNLVCRLLLEKKIYKLTSYELTHRLYRQRWLCRSVRTLSSSCFTR